MPEDKRQQSVSYTVKDIVEQRLPKHPQLVGDQFDQRTRDRAGQRTTSPLAGFVASTWLAIWPLACYVPGSRASPPLHE